ncbi:MAG: hypothetical protein ACQETE_12875 [Bacteroidota bacterium]
MNDRPQHKWIEWAKKIITYSLQAGILIYLFYQLYEIGFTQVIQSLPLNPWFYILFLIIYASLPLSEVLIYRVNWHFKLKDALAVFVQKKVLNTDVLGYSGEFYLFYWARNKLGIEAGAAMKFIKDNNILSSVASTIISFSLLLFFVLEGYINIYDYLPKPDLVYIIIGIVAAIVIGLVIYKFRSYVISLSLMDGVKIYSIYTVRLLIINVLQILQWMVVKPDIPLGIWFSLMAVQIMASRIPFLPSRDVLYVNLALEMTNLIRIPQTELVGILTANLILKKLISFISFGITTVKEKKSPTVDQQTVLENMKSES